MKDPLIIDEEKQITKEDLDKEKKEIEIKKVVDKLGYKDEDPYLSANFISKLFFFWVFRTIRVKFISFLKYEILFYLLFNINHYYLIIK